MNLADKARRAMGDRTYADIARLMSNKPENVRKWIDGGTMPLFGAGVRFCLALGMDPIWAADDDADWPPPKSDETQSVELVRDALAGAGLAGELADDERTLLTGWRRLPDGPRQRILGMMQGFLDAGEAYKSTDPKDLQLLRDVEALLKRDAASPQQPPKREERTA